LGSTLGFLLGPSQQGINKDSLSCNWSPHYLHHRDAASLAIDATKQYFDDIKDAINNEHQLRHLFGVGPTLAFAIDTTGSMDDIIASVSQQTISIAQSRIGTPDEPSLYVVSPFNDPSTGPVTVTPDIEKFKSTVLALTAGGGGDCPELSITGMLNAVQLMEEQSTLFMFTDADPKDFDMVDQLLSIADEKKINIYPNKFDSNCDDGAGGASKLKRRASSISNRIYGQIAASTGGQYHSGPRGEVRNLSSILDTVITGDSSTVLRVVDILAVGGTKTFTVPVDSYMNRVSFSLRSTGTNFSLVITQPDSKRLDTTDPGVSRTLLSDSVFISVNNPQHGEYTATVTGAGNFTLSCMGVSSLHLSSFSFATVRGRAGHTGWYPITGPPPYNQRIGALADIAGPFTSANFTFRTSTFSVITTPPMNAGSGDFGFPPANSFFTILDVPNQDFLIYVSGTDKGGNKYQRMLDSVIKPVFSNATFPLSGNQTFPTNITSSNSSTVPCSTSTPITSPSIRWGNVTSTKTVGPVLTLPSPSGPTSLPTSAKASTTASIKNGTTSTSTSTTSTRPTVIVSASGASATGAAVLFYGICIAALVLFL
jgi:hypothetical protein